MRTTALALVSGLVLGAATGAMGRRLELAMPASDRPPLLEESLALRMMVLVGTLVLVMGWAFLLRRGGSWAALAAFAIGCIVATGIGYEAIAAHPSSTFSGIVAFGPGLVLATMVLVVGRVVRAATAK